MWDPDGHRLPSWVEDGYEVLAPEIREHEDGMHRDDATTVLTDHESDELGRIDTKRVGQYIDEHDLEESGDDTTRGQQDTNEAVGMTPTTDRQSNERWELHDVQALSTGEITDKLAEHDIDTTEASFRDRAAAVDSAMALADQWENDHDIDASGYDQDFIWMAAEVLWSRWAPNLPYRERIYDLVQEGRELREQGDDAEACQRWLSAWEIIVAVTPDDITTIEAADDHLPNVLSLEAFLRSVDNDLATLAADDPTYHERRLEFCREVCTQFPDAPDELLLDFRHFVADSLTELGQLDESRNEFETLIRAPTRRLGIEREDDLPERDSVASRRRSQTLIGFSSPAEYTTPI